MCHSIHAYQSTESIENHWKDKIYISISYQYYFFKKQSLDVLSLKVQYNNVSVNASHMREREADKQRPAEREGARR